MEKYFNYIRTDINSNIIKKILYLILLSAIILLIITQDIFHMFFINNDVSIRTYVIRVSLFVILYISSIFAMDEYVDSPEYNFFRSFELSSLFRAFILCYKMLPYALLYTVFSILYRDVNNGLAVYQAVYSLCGIIAISIFTYNLYIIVKNKMFKSKKIFICILSILLPLIIATIIYKGDNELMIHNKFFLPKWYMLSLFIAWLTMYSSKDHLYEKTILKIRTQKVENKNTKIFTKLYSNLFYKDMLSSLSNYIVILVYIISFVLGCISAIYNLNISFNMAIAIILTFITSTLSEKIMKNDMKNISFLRTLPISQRDYFKYKIFSVSTVLFIPSLIFLTVSLLGYSYTFISWILILHLVLIINIVLCAMHCVLIMRYISSPEKVEIIHTILFYATIAFPLIPVLYLLIAIRKSRNLFCGGYE